jgi:hypothetical protein
MATNSNVLPRELDKDLSKENPLPGQNYHPEEMAQLNTEQLGRGEDFYSGHLNEGVGEGMLATDHSNDPMVQALQGGYNGYQSQQKEDSEAVKTRNSLNAPMMKADADTKAAGQLGAQYQNEVSNFNEQYAYQMKRHAMLNQWKVAKARAEAGMYGAIFSGIGAAGGAFLGGGGGSGGGMGQGKTGGGSNNVGTQNQGGW